MLFKLFIIPFLIFSLPAFAQTEDTTVVLSVNAKRTLQEIPAEEDFPDFTKMGETSKFKKNTKSDIESAEEILKNAQRLEKEEKLLIKTDLLLMKASNNLCEKDTTNTVAYLEELAREVENRASDQLVKLKLSTIYRDWGKLDKAENLLLTILYAPKLDTKSYFGLPYRYNVKCYMDFSFHNFSKIKSDACIGLAQIAIKRKDLKKALAYLNDAETTYMPSFDCGNAWEMQVFSIKKAYMNGYQAMGDTAMFIKTGLETLVFLGEMPKDMVLDMRNILLTKYTPIQLSQQIEKDIKDIRIKRYEDNGKMNFNVQLSLLGYEIKDIHRWNYTFNSTATDEEILKSTKEYLLHNTYLNILKNGE